MKCFWSRTAVWKDGDIMKAKRFVLILAAAIVLSALWGWRYVSLNRYYQSLSDRTRQVYPAGEFVSFGTDWVTKDITANGYSVRIDDFRILDYEDYIATLDSSYEEPYGKPDKLALVYITLRNDNSTEEGVMLTDLKLHGIDNYVGMNWDILVMANPVLSGYYGINIAVGKEYQLILPFDLDKEFFGSDTWRDIEGYMFYLHITAYPAEKDIKVR